jgi:hypothetical protein
MAKLVLKNCYVELDTVNISDHVKSVEITMSKEDIDGTTFGSGGNKEHLFGLNDDKFAITFFQDFAASSIDTTLYNLYNTEATCTIKVRPTSAAVSATNPNYTGTCVLMEYVPLSGDVGSAANVEAEFMSQGTKISRVIV